MRSVVKHSYLPTASRGKARAKAHVKYVQHRDGKDKGKGPRLFFSADSEGIAGSKVKEAIDRQTDRSVVMHKLIVSPGVSGVDVQEYTREIMTALGQQKGLDLDWYAVVHSNTANPHAHVVIMGRDKREFQVRIKKADYEPIKQAGDEYLYRNKHLERQPAKDKGKRKGAPKKSLGERLLSMLRAAKRRLLGEKEKVEVRQSRVELEEASLGKAPTWQEQAQKREESERKLKEQAWQSYARPIIIKQGGKKTEYLWTQSLDELRKLERLAKVDEGVKAQLREPDLARLQRWIKDGYAEQKANERKAASLFRVEVTVSADKEVTLTKESSAAEIREILELVESGEVVLLPHEQLTLDQWQKANSPVKQTRLGQKNSRGLPGPSSDVSYDKEAVVEALKFLSADDGSKANKKVGQGKKPTKLKERIRNREKEMLKPLDLDGLI
jgi:hypothetical protein